MRTKNWCFGFGLGLVIVSALACSFSVTTASISALKLGKDKEVSQETTSFGTGDTVYAVATISYNPGKVKVTGRLLVEDIPGQKSGPIPGLENTVDLSGNAPAIFTFSPPPAGWPKGKYKMEVLMLNEDGKQEDQKTLEFTVS